MSLLSNHQHGTPTTSRAFHVYDEALARLTREIEPLVRTRASHRGASRAGLPFEILPLILRLSQPAEAEPCRAAAC